MYLRGLSAVTVIPGVAYNSCLNMHGAFSGNPMACNNQPSSCTADLGNCTIVTADTSAPAANINVSVPTTTTVSPQVSPNLIQQQQPTNSPVGATTSQTQPTDSPVSTSTMSPDVQALIDALAKSSAQQSSAAMAPSGGYAAPVDTGSSAPAATNTVTTQPAPATHGSIWPLVLLAGAAFLVLKSHNENKGKRNVHARAK